MTHQLLAVCHSVGDSQVIFETAKEMLKLEKSVSTTILVVGTAARQKINALLTELTAKEASFIKLLDIDELLSETLPIKNNALNLDAAAIQQLTQAVHIESFNALLVGTPSYAKADEQCSIPEQLLTAWSPLLHSTVVSDYAFYDPAHLLAKNRWFSKAKEFFLPFSKAKTAYDVTDDMATVVGHPAIDAAKKLYHNWAQERVIKDEKEYDQRYIDIRNKLDLKTDEKFIFVAAGKAGDEELLKALTQVVKTYPKIKIFFGMHPAASEEYLTSLQQQIDTAGCTEQVKILPKGKVTTDEAVYAAEGVMTVSSTVGTVAATCGKLAAFYQEGKKQEDPSIPYIVADSDLAIFSTEHKELLSFFERVSQSQGLMSKDKLVCETTAAENIAKRLSLAMK